MNLFKLLTNTPLNVYTSPYEQPSRQAYRPQFRQHLDTVSRAATDDRGWSGQDGDPRKAYGRGQSRQFVPHMQNPTINPATRLEFQKILNKMGKLEPDGKAVVGVDGGPQVIINITRAKDNKEEVVIEGTSAAIEAWPRYYKMLLMRLTSRLSSL